MNNLRVEHFDLLLQKHCLLLVFRIESRILNMASPMIWPVLTSEAFAYTLQPLLPEFQTHGTLSSLPVAGFFLLQGPNTGYPLKNLSIVFLIHPSKCLSKVTLRKSVTGQISLSHALSSYCICFFLSFTRTVIIH